MDSKNQQVEHIKSFLAAKVDGLRGKISAYDTPMMQEMLKHSTHLQLDFIRMKGELTAYEDALLAIDNFIPTQDAPSSKAAQSKTKTNGKTDNGSKSGK